MWTIGTKTHTFMLLTKEEKIDVYREDRDVYSWGCFRKGEKETYIHVSGETMEYRLLVPTDMAQDVLTYLAEQIREADCESDTSSDGSLEK